MRPPDLDGAPGLPPLVSVVIPARNEERYIRGCLEALRGQDYPPDCLELLVVDGRSTDATREIVAEIARQDPRVRLLDNPAGTIPHALNVGIRAARGSVVARMDGHAAIGPEYISRCVRVLQATGADNVGGRTRFHGTRFWGETIALAIRSRFAGPAKFRHATRPQDVDTLFPGTFRREALERVGLFDESLTRNEDFELNYRIRRSGGRVYYTPEIEVHYFGRDSLRALWSQYWNYGRAKAVVSTRHPASVHPRHLAAPLLVAALGSGVLLAALGRKRPLLTLLALYGGVAAAFARHAAAGRGWRLTGAVALAFGCIHVSWGSGVLFELFSLCARAVWRACPGLHVRSAAS